MSNKSQERPTSKHLADIVVEHNPQARITHQLARQLEPYLPITSIEKIAEELSEVDVDKHRLPFKMFIPHISKDLFPIKDVEDLVQKLSTGVRQALALAHTPSFSIKNQAIAELLATSLQGEPRRRSAIPVAYYTGPSSSEPGCEKGGE
ncbi:MAG: hypothetical protein JRI80_13235 [Deltaproteobacteria bacterium]|nr:hypothetical protein [Deltaproteobacteria bacterium]